MEAYHDAHTNKRCKRGIPSISVIGKTCHWEQRTRFHRTRMMYIKHRMQLRSLSAEKTLQKRKTERQSANAAALARSI